MGKMKAINQLFSKFFAPQRTFITEYSDEFTDMFLYAESFRPITYEVKENKKIKAKKKKVVSKKS
jgi:hypothetical protein